MRNDRGSDSHRPFAYEDKKRRPPENLTRVSKKVTATAIVVVPICFSLL
jgi:hypothetical protein